MRRRSTACSAWPAVPPRGGPAAEPSAPDSRGRSAALAVVQYRKSGRSTARASVERVREDRPGLKDGEGDRWSVGRRGARDVGTRAAVHAEGGAPGGGQRGGVGAG